MASYLSDVWECKLCEARYVGLYDLVSHVRAAHSHERYLLVCGVRGCPRSFQQANSWYRHIRNAHSHKYQRREPFPNLDDANGGLHSELIHLKVLYTPYKTPVNPHLMTISLVPTPNRLYLKILISSREMLLLAS